ncbi:helix-turn-helix transcriptional regulator [Rufibacter sp. XAAS-G3-1]|uniref:helix-turn-helix transcriptional regulator n=1 Tax=Rufibacter sp. XAAS-G3-1 TaxID=2729134 RepID=UPI0015E7DA90|nr:helix-turn-helix transcriptional regulator [Rufibacter sp. XAAS-G3-1]
MKEDSAIKTDAELFQGASETTEEPSNVKIMQLTAAALHQHVGTRVYLRSSMFILVLNGTAALEINFKAHDVGQNNIILLSFGHFFKILEVSPDFKGVVLYVSQEYVEAMFSSEMVYKRVKYGVKMHKTPLLQLSPQQSELLAQRIAFLQEVVTVQRHLYYQEMVLNALHIFFLELSNIIEQAEQPDPTAKPSRDELYFQRFLELLVLHYKTQHHVEFYAEKLHITPHYLTQIVKRLCGQTVADLLFQLLFSEAKLLLQQPGLTIQQIAQELNFSDQSAFGKFFKRNSGVSPKEFRNRVMG